MMDKLVPLIVASCLLVASSALEIKEKELPCDRLPTNVVPTEYDLELEFPSLESQTYRGHVDISLKFPKKEDYDHERLFKGVESCEFKGMSNTIVLHADPSLKLENVAVRTDSCGPLDCITGGDGKRMIKKITRDSKRQLIAIKLWKSFNAGTSGKLSISFAGKLRDDKRGVYLSTFNDGTKTYKHVVSQFQPTDARTVFPVFDEPRFKARFQVRLVHPRGLTALGNTEVGSTDDLDAALTRTTFKQTPLMSVHMVAFTVGQFDEPLEVETKSKVGDHSYKVRVFTAPGLRESGHFALEVAKGSLEYFEKYIRYQFPLDKFDIVAIADHDKDNTESWGLSFIRDSLVWIDDETKPDTKITTAVNVAHVCVHQWFANLVTAAWWSDLWITEGVAAQFAFNIVRQLYPDFESEYFVRLATLSGVMQLDAPGKLHPLSPPPNELRTSEQIYELFDNVEFMKSGSLAQTVNKLLDKKMPDRYRDFLRKLVSEFAFKNVNYKDYLKVMDSVKGFTSYTDNAQYIEDFEDLIDSQISIRGVPLVNSELHNETHHHIRVELLATARSAMDLPPVARDDPVMVYDDVRANSEYNLKHGQSFDYEVAFSDNWLKWDTKPKFVKIGVNPDINTYYRTRYSPADYSALCMSIAQLELSPMDRLQILDDANELIKWHTIGEPLFKRLVECYEDENNGAVLIKLLDAIHTAVQLKGKPIKATGAISRVFEQSGFSVSGKESFLEQRSRQVILNFLVGQGHAKVIEAALKTFDEGPVALFLREPVYAAVVARGTEAQKEVLLAKMRATKSYEEKVRLATALSSLSDLKHLSQWYRWLKCESGLKEEVAAPLIFKVDVDLKIKLYEMGVGDCSKSESTA